MYCSLHYYVLLLSEKSSRLFEGFRDMLIEISNGGFPSEFFFHASPLELPQVETHLTEFYKKVNQLFFKFYTQDPLGLVLVGEKKSKSVFKSISAGDIIIFCEVEGNYNSTSLNDLGQIVWANVRKVLAGTHEKAFRELAAAIRAQKVASGLEEVWLMANSMKGATLLVEEDYHVKGSIVITDHSWILSEQVDLREVFDDMVDRVIDKVLEMEGTVIFLENGSLAEHHQIVLIFHSCGF